MECPNGHPLGPRRVEVGCRPWVIERQPIPRVSLETVVPRRGVWPWATFYAVFPRRASGNGGSAGNHMIVFLQLRAGVARKINWFESP